MYAAPADEPGTSTWGSHGTSRATNATDGDGNTLLLSGFGSSAHPAAHQCAAKIFGGADDWYMPAENEITVLYNSGSPVIPGLNMSGTKYWASNQHDATSAKAKNYLNAGFSNDGKSANYLVRCVRKGPAPRCASPYGLEGSLIYNADHDVVQYCDGARWIAIGKRAP
jgi:hypothetical protein